MQFLQYYSNTENNIGEESLANTIHVNDRNLLMGLHTNKLISKFKSVSYLIRLINVLVNQLKQKPHYIPQNESRN